MSKIIIIGPAHPLRGGLASFNERLARQFTSEGHEVIIYTFSLQYPSILFPGKTQYSDSPKPQDLGIKVAINTINPFNWWKIGHALKNEKADIILVRYWLPFLGPCLGTILRMVKKNKYTKIVGLIDNALPHEKRPGDSMFTNFFVKPIDVFITMSDYVKNDLRQFTKKKIHFVQHPLYDNFGVKKPSLEAKTTLGLADNVFIFLFFGFIRKYKGLDILIEAFAKISEKNKNFILLIAGEYYAGEEEIKHQISTSPAKEKIITHTHFIKDEEVSNYFSAADCVVQPYRNATQSGVTPLAYHFEVPMIVTNVGSLPDLVPNSLGYVCEANPDALAEAMLNMLSFDLVKFKLAIHEEKKKLSWKALSDIIINAEK